MRVRLWRKEKAEGEVKPEPRRLWWRGWREPRERRAGCRPQPAVDSLDICSTRSGKLKHGRNRDSGLYKHKVEI